MTDHHREDTISSARATRVELQREMMDVEVAVQAPAGISTWRPGLFTALHDLTVALESHIQAVEGTEGIIEQAVAVAPRTEILAQRLRDDHPMLRDKLQAAIDRLGAAGPELESSDVDDVRAQVEELLVALHRHRRQGSDFVWEAYGLDIGGVE